MEHLLGKRGAAQTKEEEGWRAAERPRGEPSRAHIASKERSPASLLFREKESELDFEKYQTESATRIFLNLVREMYIPKTLVLWEKKILNV